MHNPGHEVQSEPQPLSILDFPEAWREAKAAVEMERRIGKGDLYFVLAGGDAVKIGHTANIVNRLAKMQADNHEKLDCLVVLRGRGFEEPAWHRAFQAYRIRVEWFAFAPEVEKAIEEARQGGEWWNHLFPDDDCLADATVDYLDDDKAEEFEEAYWDCVAEFRFRIEDDLSEIAA